MGSERRPKDAAGRGVTSTLRPRNIGEEDKQREERVKIYHENLTRQAGRPTSEIGILRAGLGRRLVKSHRPGRSSARDLNISRAGPDAVGPPSLGPVQSARVGPTRKDPWIFKNTGSFYNLTMSRIVT